MKHIITLMILLTAQAHAISVKLCPKTLDIKLSKPSTFKEINIAFDELLEYFNGRSVKTSLDFDYQANSKCFYKYSSGDQDIHSITIEGSLRKNAVKPAVAIVYARLPFVHTTEMDLSGVVSYIGIKKIHKKTLKITTDKFAKAYRMVDQCSWGDCLTRYVHFGNFEEVSLK